MLLRTHLRRSLYRLHRPLRTTMNAQSGMGGMQMGPGDAKKMPSPPATSTSVTLAGQTLTIHYNTPHAHA